MRDHKDIITSISKGDSSAFKELYDIYSANVYNTSLSYAQHVETAEEITQDVFTSIYRNASKFKGDSAVSTWIYRITVNTSLNYIKKRKRLSIVDSLDSQKDVTNFVHPGVMLEKKEDAATLFEVIETLPDSQKTAFILSYIEELPRQEVADIMETSLKAVESLLQRGKKNLRSKLEKIYPHRRKSK